MLSCIVRADTHLWALRNRLRRLYCCVISLLDCRTAPKCVLSHRPCLHCSKQACCTLEGQQRLQSHCSPAPGVASCLLQAMHLHRAYEQPSPAVTQSSQGAYAPASRAIRSRCSEQSQQGRLSSCTVEPAAAHSTLERPQQLRLSFSHNSLSEPVREQSESTAGEASCQSLGELQGLTRPRLARKGLHRAQREPDSAV